MSSNSDEKINSSAKTNTNDGTDADDDGDNLFSADLAALSIQPTLSSSSTTNTSSSPKSSPFSWHLWHYACPDFPVHHCEQPSTCEYCAEVNKLRKLCPNGVNVSQERWWTYWERGHAFENAQQMLEYVKRDMDNVLPNKLARQVFFTRKLGTAFFRASTAPMEEHPENLKGGKYVLWLFASTGPAKRQLNKGVDAIFVHTVQLISELPEPVQKCINGLFYRCEIHPMQNPPSREGRNYRDHADLPIMCRLEVWIGDAEEQQERLVYQDLITKIEAEFQNLGVYKKASFHHFTKFGK